MNKRVVRRLLETFFRRWYLYLVPLILFTGVGAYKATTTASGYRSVGVVDVSSGTLLSELTSIRGENFGYETPAAATARTINGLLRTTRFLETVVEKAGITTALRQGTLPPLGSSAISASATNDNLLRVMATTANPELSARLAKATIDSFTEYVVAGDVAESTAAEEFFQSQLGRYQQQLADAEAALDKYVVDNPGGDIDERPPAQRSAIEQLQAIVLQARDRVAATEQKVDDARLASQQATQDVHQRLRIVDEPRVASAPQSRMKDAAMTIVVFMFIGLLLSIGAVVLAAALDRSLWSADDIEHLFRLPVLATVPVAPTRGRGGAVAERAPFTSVASPPARVTSSSEAAVAASHTSKPRTSSRSPRRRSPVPSSEATT